MPAFGRPTSAASARSLRRSSISRSSPGMPTSAKRGVCRLGPAKCLLPRPPVPPFADDDARARAARGRRRARSPSKTCVPTGTASTASSPRAPFERRPPPPPPRPGAQLLVRPEAREVAPPQVGDEHDVAALAAVAAVGPAAGHVLLPPEVDRAVAAAAGDDRQSCAIVEHRGNGTGVRRERHARAIARRCAWRRCGSRAEATAKREREWRIDDESASRRRQRARGGARVSCSHREHRGYYRRRASRPAPATGSSRAGRRARSSSARRTRACSRAARRLAPARPR